MCKESSPRCLSGEPFIKFVWPLLRELIQPAQMQSSNPIRKWLVFLAQQGVYYRGPCTDCSFTFQTLSITARDLMFSLSAQQPYSSLANSPAAILSVPMQYSQHGYHKALLSSVSLTGFASILCQYHTALTETEYSTLTQRLESSWNAFFISVCENTLVQQCQIHRPI